MKRLFILIFTLVFACSFAFAQNTATTTQTGTSNKATLNQDGSNTATTSQTGDNGQITVAQNGTNTTNITQVESASSTPVGQQIATVTQQGTGNTATVHQTETGGGGHGTNRATVNQKGTDNSVMQTTYAPGSNSGQTAEARQDGLENGIIQNIGSGYTNSLFADQKGEYNSVNQDLRASHAHGKVWQDGDDNEARQTIRGTNQRNIHIRQYQDNNNASQSVSGGGFSRFQDVYIYQDGFFNEAHQKVVGASVNVNTRADIKQEGDYNKAKIDQAGPGTSKIEQIGDNNIVQGVDPAIDPSVTVNEWAIFSGTSLDVDQQNDGNVAEVNASGKVTIIQRGSDHAIASGGGEIFIEQLADVNQGFAINVEGIAVIKQDGGNNNSAWLDMHSTAGDAEIIQLGDGNKVYGLDGSLGVSDWADFTGSGLNVSQTGTDNLLNLQANGIVKVTQNGMYNTARVTQQ